MRQKESFVVSQSVDDTAHLCLFQYNGTKLMMSCRLGDVSQVSAFFASAVCMFYAVRLMVTIILASKKVSRDHALRGVQRFVLFTQLMGFRGVMGWVLIFLEGFIIVIFKYNFSYNYIKLA